jgi:hypothetical protein
MVDVELDQEWVQLMLKAMEIGLKPEEVRAFLQANGKQKEVV